MKAYKLREIYIEECKLKYADELQFIYEDLHKAALNRFNGYTLNVIDDEDDRFKNFIYTYFEEELGYKVEFIDDDTLYLSF